MIAGVPGAALTRSAPRATSPREWRGIFMFKPEHQSAIAKIVDESCPTIFEGTIEGRAARLDVKLTGLAQGAGLAFFEAEGEPY